MIERGFLQEANEVVLGRLVVAFLKSCLSSAGSKLQRKFRIPNKEKTAAKKTKFIALDLEKGQVFNLSSVF